MEKLKFCSISLITTLGGLLEEERFSKKACRRAIRVDKLWWDDKDVTARGYSFGGFEENRVLFRIGDFGSQIII